MFADDLFDSPPLASTKDDTDILIPFDDSEEDDFLVDDFSTSQEDSPTLGPEFPGLATDEADTICAAFDKYLDDSDEEPVPTSYESEDDFNLEESPEPEPLPPSENDKAIKGIEDLVLSFLTQLSVANSNTETAQAKHLTSANRIELSIADRRKAQPQDGTQPVRTLKFPMKSKGPSIKPFAQLFRVADLAHEALIKDTPMTKRDIYYMDVPLFKTQSVVDRLVDDLAATIDVGRAELNIRASSKGLLCGSSLCIHLLDGQAIHATDSEPILIPVAEDIERFELKQEIQWVLIVEKDAVFQTLCRAQLTSIASLSGPGIMITGKGYPDLATRQLVRTLSDNLPESIPVLALVDGDAFGIDIASVYKFGSHALRHEKEKLAADRVECIGVVGERAARVHRDAMLPITKADEKKARAMLRRSCDMMPLRWKQELARMLHTRRKAETEILSTIKSSAFDEPSEFPAFASSEPTSVIGHPLVRYLTAKITQHLELFSDSLLAPGSPVSTDSYEDLLVS
ncbi:hypothetical protein EVG20_g2339 [Dentipellis fragilis]|uniref:DNA topoisomerase (ATP-hydrolyzing) n=1 Tax=Dentipellis fragilis TaxID=205917 RepID=A0A4Y9Z810_9AGAM|nr:hypothetical protein EVG20_g2339 [Dentipellis fragilis]